MGQTPVIGRSSAAVHERLRYLATFGEHVALAAALRSVRARPAPPDAEQRRFRVTFLSPHPITHRAVAERFKRWVPHLEPRGCEVEILGPSTESQFADYKRRTPGADTRYHHACIRDQWHNLRRAASADVVVLHRGLFPFSPWQRPTYEDQLARLNPRLVYDFFDPIWIQRRQVSEQSSSRLAQWLHPPDKIEQIIRLARIVTVSNDHLAEFARRHHGDVRIVPLLLETQDYEPRRHEPRSPVVLGWLGSANNLPRLLSLAPALRRLAADRDIILRVVAPEPVEIPGVHVESLTHPWSPESELKDLAALDIGLLPLDENSPDDRGKSPFKLLQYCAAGLAVVATPIAMDQAVLKPDECFLPARTEDGWVAGMTRLVDDVGLRARLGRTARKAVVDHYSFAGHADAFVDILRTAAGRNRRDVPTSLASVGW